MVVSERCLEVAVVSAGRRGLAVSAAVWDLPVRAIRNKEADKNVRMGKGTTFSLKNKELCGTVAHRAKRLM